MEIKPYLRRPQFYETDGMSIIWHGNYVRWMEEARVDYLAQLGWGLERLEAMGVPCRVVREIGPRDKEFYFRDYRTEDGLQ